MDTNHVFIAGQISGKIVKKKVSECVFDIMQSLIKLRDVDAVELYSFVIENTQEYVCAGNFIPSKAARTAISRFLRIRKNENEAKSQ